LQLLELLKVFCQDSCALLNPTGCGKFGKHLNIFWNFAKKKAILVSAWYLAKRERSLHIKIFYWEL
jgi:hypothetical protein